MELLLFESYDGHPCYINPCYVAFMVEANNYKTGEKTIEVITCADRLIGIKDSDRTGMERIKEAARGGFLGGVR